MIRIFLILILQTSFIHAAIITVDRNDDLMNINDGGCDLRDAINSANFNSSFGDCIAGGGNDTDFIIISASGPIQLADEIDVLSSVSISPPFGSSELVTIIAAKDERIFEVHPTFGSSNDFQMINLRLINGGHLESDGGALVFYRFNEIDLGDIYLSGNVFENNKGSWGGAIAFDQTNASSVRILRNVFINNRAQDGGAISAQGAATGEFIMSLNDFENNQAIDNGGTVSAAAVILVDDGEEDYTIQKNVFKNNSSAGSAGALYLLGSNGNTQQFYEVDQNVFLHNHADGVAGAVYVGDLAFADLDYNTMAFNSAQRGGALVNLGGKTYLNHSTLVHNYASGPGQNIYIFNGVVNINSNVIAYPVDGENCAGDFTNVPNGSNASDDESCPHNNNFYMGDPLLSGLMYHSTGRPGFVPTADSIALDRYQCEPGHDQQNHSTPIDGSGDGTTACDWGAIEAPASTDLIWSDSLGG